MTFEHFTTGVESEQEEEDEDGAEDSEDQDAHNEVYG